MRVSRIPVLGGARSLVSAAALTVCALAVATPVRAELVTFSTGRAMSVRSHREEEGSIVLVLRRGGEMVVEPALIASIGPDEVPYPEPEVAEVGSKDPTLRTRDDQQTVSSAFDPLIVRVAAEKGVDASLVRAVIQVESA